MKKTWLAILAGTLMLGGVTAATAQLGNPIDPTERAISHLEKARAALTEQQIREDPQVQLAYDEVLRALEALRESRQSGTTPDDSDPFAGRQPFGMTPFPWGFGMDPFGEMQGDVFGDMRRMREEADAMMRRAFDEMRDGRARSYSDMGMLGSTPDMDIEEDGDRYVVTMDLPGVAKDDVRVEARENHLQISGTREERVMESSEGEGFIRRERRVGSFSRTVPLPGPIDPGRMEARLEDGVLTIMAPKKEAEQQESQIVIVK